MVGLLRIAPAARAVAPDPPPLVLGALVSLTNADGLTNASATPKKTSAAAAIITRMAPMVSYAQSKRDVFRVCLRWSREGWLCEEPKKRKGKKTENTKNMFRGHSDAKHGTCAGRFAASQPMCQNN